MIQWRGPRGARAGDVTSGEPTLGADAEWHGVGKWRGREGQSPDGSARMERWVLGARRLAQSSGEAERDDVGEEVGSRRWGAGAERHCADKQREEAI